MADVKELNINNTTYDIKAKSVVDQNSGSLKMWTGTKAQYDAIATKDSATFYTCTDSGEIYIGTTLIANKAGSRDIGDLVPSITPKTDAGLHLLDGALIDGSGIYSAFVTHIAGLVTDYPDLFVTEADWQTSVTTYGSCGKFVYDSTNNTVRLPKISDILQGTTDVTALGDLIASGLPQHDHTRGSMNITGSFNIPEDRNLSPAGAFTQSTKSNFNTTDTSGNGKTVSFNASSSWTGSTSNANYTSTTATTSKVQPQAIKVLYYIVVATTTKTDIEVDIDEIATDLNGKADRDGSNMVSSVKNFDGQWVKSYVELQNTTTVGTYTLSLANYLPQDGYSYEILVRGNVVNNNDGTNTYLNISSDIITNNFIGMGSDNNMGGLWIINSSIIPAKTYLKTVISGNPTGCKTELLGYRRIGTNS